LEEIEGRRKTLEGKEADQVTATRAKEIIDAVK
jgi:hypothetical protein